MRSWLVLLAACQGAPVTEDTGDSATPTPTDTDTDTDTTVTTTDTGTVKTTGPDPCDPVEGLSVDDVVVTTPWSEHEVSFDVYLTMPAAVAVACQLEGDDEEIHLVEGTSEVDLHTLSMAGLLAGSTYQCRAAPVCPTSLAAPYTFEITTDAQSNQALPDISVTVQDARAGNEYILTNHQRFPNWNGQRRIVVDRDGQFRHHMSQSAGGSAGGSAVSWHVESQTFTIGGGWPPNNNGRPQQISLLGSTTLYDTKPYLPNYENTQFHHEARQLEDGRFLTLEEPTLTDQNGSTFRGFGVRIVDPDTNSVVFDYNPQQAIDDGRLFPVQNNDNDRFHANWADVVPNAAGDEILYVSLCHSRDIVAIDVPSGDFRWRLGEGGDFTLVDENGQPLTNGYPACQHGLEVRDDKILVYDNGIGRGQSRVSEFQIDETTMTATRLWTWTEPGWYEQSLGGVNYGTGNRVLIARGHIEGGGSNGDVTRFVEIDHVTGEKLWEMRYALSSSIAFRLQALKGCEIFANGKYCPVVAQRLTTLSEVLWPKVSE